MMGIAIIGTDQPVCKHNNAILAFDKRDTEIKPQMDCIRCGYCSLACPMSLMPTLIERYTKAKDIDKLKKIGIDVCMECGSCAYSCPSGRPLVQYMRLANQFSERQVQENER
jgi:electron transport complex protein RnfC